MTTETTTPRDFSRQQYLIGHEKLAETPIRLVGCGAGGRQLAILLASAGIRQIELFDHDTVEASNITTQGYWASQIGRPKPQALVETMRLIDPNINIVPHCRRWTPTTPSAPRGSIVISAVDSMEVRKQLHKAERDRCALWLEGRTLGETAHAYGAATPAQHDEYETTLFDDIEAEPGRCTSEATIYTAALGASLVVYNLARWSRGLLPIPAFGGLPCEILPL